jgi:hypothetical protein
MSETPAHLAPSNCYVCGWPKDNHSGNVAGKGHVFWPNADADKDLAAEPQGDSSAEARYVAEYRPY